MSQFTTGQSVSLLEKRQMGKVGDPKGHVRGGEGRPESGFVGMQIPSSSMKQERLELEAFFLGATSKADNRWTILHSPAAYSVTWYKWTLSDLTFNPLVNYLFICSLS